MMLRYLINHSKRELPDESIYLLYTPYNDRMKGLGCYLPESRVDEARFDQVSTCTAADARRNPPESGTTVRFLVDCAALIHPTRAFGRIFVGKRQG